MSQSSGVEHAQLMVVEVDDLVGVADEGGGVAGQEVLAVADADDQRAAEPGADDQPGLRAGHRREAVGALEQRQRLAHGLDQVAVEMRRDQLGDDLGVGLAAERDALGLELLLERSDSSR